MGEQLLHTSTFPGTSSPGLPTNERLTGTLDMAKFQEGVVPPTPVNAVARIRYSDSKRRSSWNWWR